MEYRSEKIIVEGAGNLEIGAAATVSVGAAAEFRFGAEALLEIGATSSPTGSLGTPASMTGVLVYDSTTNKICVFTGSAWETVTSA